MQSIFGSWAEGRYTMAISQRTVNYSYMDSFCPDDFLQWISIDIHQTGLRRPALQCCFASTILVMFYCHLTLLEI